jgi:hypothetical protein
MSSGTFEVKIGKEVYEVDAKDETEAWQLANKFHASTPPEPAPKMGVGESIVSALKDAPRQLGLTARYGIEGTANTLGLPVEPLRQAVGAISGATGGPEPMPLSTMGQKLADLLGLPKPRQTSVMDRPTGLATVLPSEEVVGDVARSMASAGSFMPAASVVQKATTGVTSNVAGQLAANPSLQTLAAAGSGYGGGSVREAGGDPLQQLGASLVGGMVAPLAVGGVKAGVTGATQRFKPEPSIAEVDQVITLKLGQSGLDFSRLPEQVQKSLRADVQNAMKTGGDLGGDAMRRLLDFRMIEGATPTKGMVTLDPRQITLEQNLAKAGMNSQDINLQTLGNVQNQNNQALINALNQRGAGNVQAPYLMEAGEASVGKISAMDAAKQAETSALYKAAQDTAGGTIPLDRSGLINNIDAALSAQNKNAFLPTEIRNTLNAIAKGETTIDGKSFPVPFDVNALDNLMTTIATASRSTTDGNVKGALKIVRDAIDKTEIKPIKADLGGGLVTAETGAALRAADAQPKELLDALNAARASHRLRMAWVESSKPVEATVNGMQPDQFVRKFVLSGDVADAQAVAKSGDPTATKNAILTHLKDRALGGRSDETGTFGAATYNKTLKDIGDKKLELFFSPEEITELKRLGRVAEYMTLQPKGSAVNNSNSGALVLGAGIDVLANSVGMGFPGVATLAVPIGRKLLQGNINALDQKKALDMAKALANETPGISLGQRAVPASVYAGFLSNPDLLRQIGQ